MKKIKFSNVFSLFFGCICLFLCVFFPFIKIQDKTLASKTGYKAVITIWQIDSFEGGTGSRATFLRNVANEYHKKYSDVLFLVVSHSINSAINALNENKIPDIISYGNCGLDVASLAKSLGATSENDGGVVGGKRYATAWLKGCYFYVTHKDQNNGDIKTTYVVENETYSGALAILGNDLKTKNQVFNKGRESVVSFMLDKNSCLIATQREIVRLQNNEVSFTATPLNDFCDLYQYASVTTISEEKFSYCQAFIDYLTSEQIQQKVVNLKMFSPYLNNLYDEDAVYKTAEKCTNKYTLSPFMKKEQIIDIKNQAKESVLTDKGQEAVIKLFKQL